MWSGRRTELLRIKLQLATGGSEKAGPEPLDGFAALVSRIVLTGQGVQPRDLAAALGISYSALHARLMGRAAFMPDELRLLFQRYPEPRIADYLLAGTRFVAIDRPVSAVGEAGQAPLRVGLRALRELIDLSRRLLTAEAPGARQPTEVVRSVDEALRQLAVLHWSLTHLGRHSSGDCADSWLAGARLHAAD